MADDSALSFLGEGKASLSFRYRYEMVDQDGLSEKAHASTLRTRLTFSTPEDHVATIVLEADNILRLGGANYSDGNRSVPQHPVVADPKGTEINQAYLALKPERNLKLSFGRQRINLDDQRFVGGVGWRQNEQTYDSARLNFILPGDATLNYSYLWNVNRIFGPEGGDQASDWHCRCHLLNLGLTPFDTAILALFAYELDIEDAAALSNRTIGARLSGSVALANETSLEYLVSYARQQDAGDNTTDYSAPYIHLRAGFKIKPLAAAIGFESLGGDANRGAARFVTPLATLHAFNGWADKFLATPDAGLEDLYGQVSFSFAGLDTSIIYHRFTAESGGADYGNEWNVSIAKKLGRHLSLLGKFATYDSEGHASDTDKFWLMASYTP